MAPRVLGRRHARRQLDLIQQAGNGLEWIREEQKLLLNNSKAEGFDRKRRTKEEVLIRLLGKVGF